MRLSSASHSTADKVAGTSTQWRARYHCQTGQAARVPKASAAAQQARSASSRAIKPQMLDDLLRDSGAIDRMLLPSRPPPSHLWCGSGSARLASCIRRLLEWRRCGRLCRGGMVGSGCDRNIGPAEPTFDQNDLTHIVSFDPMPYPLKHIARPQQSSRPPPQVPSPLQKLYKRQKQRRNQKRDAHDVQCPAHRVLMSFPIAFPPRRHLLPHFAFLADTNYYRSTGHRQHGNFNDCRHDAGRSSFSCKLGGHV